MYGSSSTCYQSLTRRELARLYGAVFRLYYTQNDLDTLFNQDGCIWTIQEPSLKWLMLHSHALYILATSESTLPLIINLPAAFSIAVPRLLILVFLSSTFLLRPDATILLFRYSQIGQKLEMPLVKEDSISSRLWQAY